MISRCQLAIIASLLLVLGVTYWPRMPYAPKPGYLLNEKPSDLKSRIEALTVIQAVNERNRQIRTFTCPEIKIRIWNKEFIKLTGNMAYEKDKNFRMIVKSIITKELDLGSNESYFWFWSRRMKPSVLYYSKHENLYRTGLRTPFHPLWMKGSLGLDEIPTSGIHARRRGFNWEFLQLTRNTQGKRVLRSILVDPKRSIIVGQYVYKDSKLMVSSEIYEYRDGLPHRAIVKWYEEDVVMILEFVNPKINQGIIPSTWVRPSMRGEIEIGE